MKDLFDNEPMRSLSWKEPFASLMLHGKWETRVWPTAYRGLVLICATQYAYTETNVLAICGADQYNRIRKTLGDNFYKHDTTHGKAIAVGRLVGCRKMTDDDEDRCFVQNRTDLYVHIYEDVKMIKPFAHKGHQGWRTLERQTIKKIQYV
jgi:hypothetical protein